MAKQWQDIAERTVQAVVGENISRVFQDIGSTQDQLENFLGRYRFQSGDQVQEHQNPDFGAALEGDKRPGFTTTSARAVIGGVPGTVCTKQIVVKGSAIIRNMTLICDNNTAALLVTETGRCVLENCHIVKSDGIQGAADSYVSVANAGLLNVVGCMFHGVQPAGFVISNPVPAPVTNVDVTGCVNTTGRPHDNVTVVGEVP